MIDGPLTRDALDAIRRRWKKVGPGSDVNALVDEIERLWADRIRWSDADGYDPAYDHDWSRGDSQCALCEVSQSFIDGGPCPNKADLVAYYAPKPPAQIEAKELPHGNR